MDIKRLQTRLASLGFYRGKIDGISGPLTRKAIIEFKQSQGLRARAYVGPITISRLFPGDVRTAQAVLDHSNAQMPPWVNELHEWLGTHESDPALEEWLASDGSTVGDPDDIPWCGDAGQTSIRRTLPNEPFPKRVGDNPFLALNWLDFGVEGAYYGCFGVFWRKSPKSMYGHLAQIIGYDPVRKRYRILGGNQSDRVTITWISAKRLRKNGLRWPATYDGPRLPIPHMDSKGAILSTNES